MQPAVPSRDAQAPPRAVPLAVPLAAPSADAALGQREPAASADAPLRVRAVPSAAQMPTEWAAWPAAAVPVSFGLAHQAQAGATASTELPCPEWVASTWPPTSEAVASPAGPAAQAEPESEESPRAELPALGSSVSAARPARPAQRQSGSEQPGAQKHEREPASPGSAHAPALASEQMPAALPRRRSRAQPALTRPTPARPKPRHSSPSPVRPVRPHALRRRTPSSVHARRRLAPSLDPLGIPTGTRRNSHSLRIPHVGRPLSS